MSLRCCRFYKLCEIQDLWICGISPITRRSQVRIERQSTFLRSNGIWRPGNCLYDKHYRPTERQRDIQLFLCVQQVALEHTTTPSYSSSVGTIDNRIKEGSSGPWRGFREWPWFSAPLKSSPRRSAIADDPFPSARSSELCTASPAIDI